MLEHFAVYAIVAVCAAYSLWTLLPTALKRRIAPKNSKLAAGGCGSGCDGCGSTTRTTTTPASATKPVVWHPRRS